MAASAMSAVPVFLQPGAPLEAATVLNVDLSMTIRLKTHAASGICR